MQLRELSEGDCDQEGATCPPKNTQPGRMLSSLNRRARRFRAPNPVETEFMFLLPSLDVATLLIETYFERIHWFTLVFPQTKFRRDFRAFYHAPGGPKTGNNSQLGFLSVLLAVFALSLEYAGAHQEPRLSDYNVDRQALRDKILTTLRAGLLDVASLASIEAVQTCILLGSYYLYHGEPELA